MALVQGRPLISYSLRAFIEILSIEEIVLVVAAGREESFYKLFKTMNVSSWGEKIKIIAGGKDRHESVQKGLCALSSNVEWVAIHDGARPLISRSMIESCFQKAYEHGAAALASPITETLHRASLDHMAEKTVDRTHLWAMQTPQIFRKADLMNIKSLFSKSTEASNNCVAPVLAPSSVSDTLSHCAPPPCSLSPSATLKTDSKINQDQQPPTDEVSVLLQHGGKVYLVENREPNIKVTYLSDLDLVNRLLA